MTTAVSACLVLLILSLTVNVNSQTCSGISQYGQCSSNNGCGCLHLSFTDDIGICALIGVSCSRLSPCQSPNDACQETDHICVRHPQCNSQPLCYPLSMVDQRLCPPAMTTFIPTTPSTTGFQWTSMTTIGRPMTTTGFSWTSMPTINSTSIISNYSSALTVDSERYSHNGNFNFFNSTDATFTDGNFTDGNFTGNHYYEAIQILVNTTGYYTFKSSSNLDAYGSLYQWEFDPSNPSRNLITQDDDSAGGRQFTFNAFLQAGVSYTLVFTTFGEGETGPFSVVATGPDTVHFTPSKIRQTTTTTIASPTSYNSRYSSLLAMNSKKYARNENSSSNFYFETINVIVNTTGSYKFTSKSNIDTYGYIYQGNFYPLYPTFNLLAHDDDNGGNSQFQLTVSLQNYNTYILVVTTYAEDVTGPFSIEISGPNFLTLFQ
ncbi:unnamed protein product [Rotaria sordida]|uniref:PA14 domain-containing protein n=1 Tax=Rotaria sordida TaxID=392033 RepID=A0A820D1X7_9BILA|nr:unnamed protein product [Rotaria sordida]